MDKNGEIAKQQKKGGSEQEGGERRIRRKEVKVTMGLGRRDEALFLKIDINHRKASRNLEQQ